MTALGLRRSDSIPGTSHGRRLDALWKISTNTTLNDEDMTRALLTVAAAAMRPGQAFSTLLHRVDGPTLILEETIVREPAGSAADRGSLISLDQTPLLDVVRRGETQAAGDVAADPALAGRELVADTGMRAFIGTVLRAGDTKYTVTCYSTAPLADGFEYEDSHFMESLAALLQKLLESRLQRARILARAEAERANVVMTVGRRAGA